jgi:hypothetical protein
VYADTLPELKVKLDVLASKFTRWAKKNDLVLNASKTQLLVSSSGGSTDGFVVDVDGKEIKANPEFELLGVRYDRKLSTAPHDAAVAKAARGRASLIARLGHHLPRGDYLKQLARGLVLSKLQQALPAVASPRMSASDGVANAPYRAAQVAVNDVARTLTGRSRKQHVTVSELLELAKLPSINAMAVKAVAVETWKSYWSCDGPDGSRNPIGSHMFDSTSAVRSTRAGTTGHVQIPLRGLDTMVVHGAHIWNSSPELRRASTLAEARRAASTLARGAPL